MSAQVQEKVPEVRELTPQQGVELFDRQSREYLGISGDEFIRRFEAGEFSPDELEHSDVIMLTMLMPRRR